MLPYCVSLYTKYARPYTRTDDFLFFFLPEKKRLLSPRKRIWWHTIYISCLPSSEMFEKNLFHTINNLGKIKDIRQNENLQGHF